MSNDEAVWAMLGAAPIQVAQAVQCETRFEMRCPNDDCGQLYEVPVDMLWWSEDPETVSFRLHVPPAGAKLMMDRQFLIDGLYGPTTGCRDIALMPDIDDEKVRELIVPCVDGRMVQFRVWASDLVHFLFATGLTLDNVPGVPEETGQ